VRRATTTVKVAKIAVTDCQWNPGFLPRKFGLVQEHFHLWENGHQWFGEEPATTGLCFGLPQKTLNFVRILVQHSRIHAAFCSH